MNESPDIGIIEIDEGLCAGLGSCIAVAPDIVQLDSSGIARVTRGSGPLAVLEEIAASCPMAAIAVRRAELGKTA